MSERATVHSLRGRPLVGGRYPLDPERDVYIGRPNPRVSGVDGADGYFGNEFHIGDDGEREEVVEKYEKSSRARLAQDGEFQNRLLAIHGKRLQCWCAPLPCHGDVVATLAAEVASHHRSTSMIPSSFPELLREFRRSRRWSQSTLAEHVNVDSSLISRYESGGRTPTRETALCITEKLGLNPAESGLLLGAAGFTLRDELDAEMEAVSWVLRCPAIPEERRNLALRTIRSVASLLAKDAIASGQLLLEPTSRALALSAS